MGKIVNSTFVSLDGVVNHMDRWHFDYMDDESDALALEHIRPANAMLMGRSTYEAYAAVWPGRDGAYAEAINAVPKYIASTTLRDPSWHNTTVIDGDLTEAARALRDPDDAVVLMHGYGPVARALLEADLLDELHLWVHPHFAGVGDPSDLLLQHGVNKKLRLIDVTRLGSGVTVLSLADASG